MTNEMNLNSNNFVELTNEEIMLVDGGANLWLVAAGVVVGAVSVVASVAMPAAAPVIGGVGYRVSAALIVAGTVKSPLAPVNVY